MGLKHLRAIEEYLQKNAKESFSLKQIRNEFNLNTQTARECLAYLLDQKKIKLIQNGWDKYQWRQDG